MSKKVSTPPLEGAVRPTPPPAPPRRRRPTLFTFFRSEPDTQDEMLLLLQQLNVHMEETNKLLCKITHAVDLHPRYGSAIKTVPAVRY